MYAPVVMCDHCAHYRDGTGCRAFGDRIPDSILDGDHDHRRPYPGDNGILFEPADPQEWQDSLLRKEMDGEIPGFWRNPAIEEEKAADALRAGEKAG